MYDPLAMPTEEAEPIPLALLPRCAQKAVSNPSADAFQTIYTSAIKTGLITKQQISELFGKATLKTLSSPNSTPDPATCAIVLKFIASRKPEEATGREEPWHHASPRPRALEPAAH